MGLTSTSPLIAEAEPIDVSRIGNLASVILPELQGCSDLMIRQQLQSSLREFCKETGACVISFRVKVSGGSQSYLIGRVPCDMTVGTLISVKRNGNLLNEGVHYSIADSAVPMVNFADCVLSDGDELTFAFSVYPKVGSESCPEWFVDRYADAIVAGAMANLLRMDKRPWASEARAADYLLKYKNAKSEVAFKRLCGSQISNGSVLSAAPVGGLFV